MAHSSRSSCSYILCSACLLGIKCRYDGKSKPHPYFQKLAQKFCLIPVCPEILGGLGIPREQAEIREGKVITLSGKDATSAFLRGARETLKIARLFKVKLAIFADKSPSCGVHFIYDGSFTGKLIKGEGIATKLLREHGIRVFAPEDLRKGKIDQFLH
ncbi:DUF523 domain-containing protein [bacterium]|nr:DUF523 domain-containing protein [bacterium]